MHNENLYSKDDKTAVDQYSNNNKFDDNDSDAIEENENTDDFNRRKRRSKNDTNGRAYKCEICGKSYLSKPAMTQHTKSKHADKLSSDFKKGRGRPRKCDLDDHAKTNQEKYYQIFFDKTNRALITKEEYEINEVYNSSANIICKSNYDITNINGLFEINDLNEEIDILNLKLPIDKVMILFLKDIKNKANKEYFSFICKLIFLLREYLNYRKLKPQRFYSTAIL